MTRSDLVEKLAIELDIANHVAEKIVTEIFKGMADALISGDRIEIRGFGSFESRDYGAYTARNPKTGVLIEVKPKKSPFFKVGREMKDRLLNGGTSN